MATRRRAGTAGGTARRGHGAARGGRGAGSAGRARQPPARQPSAVPIPPGMRAWVLVLPPGESRQDWLASLALARRYGAVYDQARRVPMYVGYRLPDELADYAAPAFSWEAFLTDEINGEVTPPPPPTGRFVPRPVQREAAAAIRAAAAAGLRGFLEADDVGTGKTISCYLGMLEVARIRPLRTLLIVCPKSAIPHWRRTVADMGTQGLRVAIINYDRLRSLLSVPATAAAAARTRTRNKRIAEQGRPLVAWDGVIFDESHKLRAYGFDNDSQRALAAASLARYAQTAAQAPFVIWASATAGHAVHEVGYLAPLLAQVTGQTLGSVRDYGPWLIGQGFHVAPGGFGRYQWTADPAEREQDIAAFRSMMFDRPVPVAIRRLPDWEDVRWVPVPVALDAEQRRRYAQAWTAFRAELQLARRGQDPRAGLVARLRFRQKASLLRADETAGQVLDLLDNQRQVVVSVAFTETLDAIAARLARASVEVARFDGRSGYDREAERLRFQRGEVPVILSTVTEAVSFHAGELLPDGGPASAVPRVTVIHDPRYSGLELIQITGRAHRDGQAAPALVMYAEDTVEEGVVAVVLDRVATTKEMVGDDTSLLRSLEEVLDGGSAPSIEEVLARLAPSG